MTATWTTSSKSSTNSFTNQQVSTESNVIATAGLYYGFGSFNYAGGEVLVAGSYPVFTNQTKN